jgi:hypothetical protein
MQPPAVDDADASVAMPSAVDKPLHVRDGFRSGLGVQVEPAAWGVFSALDPSELTPIDTRRDVTLFGAGHIFMRCRRGGRRRRPVARGDLRTCANAASGVRRKRDDVRHCFCEMVNLGVGIGRRGPLR